MLDFLKALGGWGISISVLITFALIYVIANLIGELVEVGGKTVPTFFKIRKYFAAKKQAKHDKKAQNEQLATTLNDLKDQHQRLESLITDFNEHYSEDNIAKRDRWMLDVNCKMKWVDERAKVYDAALERLLSLEGTMREQINQAQQNNDKLEIYTQMTSQMYKDSSRNRILDFAHGLANARKADKPVIYSREEFRKMHRTYADYEAFLHRFGGTNGEVDDAMEIIRKAEAGELRNIEFLEDLRD